MEMKKLNSLAFLSVARGSGFALLAIVCVMAGAAYDIAISFFSGGILSLLASVILFLKALYARSQPYKNTEVWLMLEPEERPKAEIAQQLISSTLHHIYLRFARNFAILSIALLIGTMIMRVLL